MKNQRDSRVRAGTSLAGPVGMSRPLGCLTGVLALSGCTPSNAMLADLPDLQVRLLVWEARDSGPTPGTALLLYNRAKFRETRGVDECATLGSFDISLTNATITHVDHGASGIERDDDGQWQCRGPSFELAANFTADEPNTLVLEDESLTITADYGFQLTPHVPTLRSARDWTFAPGDEVVIGWSHPEDLLDTPTNSREVSWWVDNGGHVAATFIGDEIRFTIPDDIFGGQGHFWFFFGTTFREAVTSTGARCLSTVRRGYEHSASIRSPSP